MLQAFTRNYQDNSTDAGFQFTFYCDVCNDGYKSSFIESDTYKKKKGSRLLGQGIGLAGSLLGGRVRDLGYAAERGSNILSERFDGKSPEWQREHEQAFMRAQNEAKQHFHRCPSCNKYVCDHCHNEDEGLCVSCAPRQEILVAKTRADAMKRNIDDAGATATVWQGKIESKTTICPACGKPAGSGAFCNNCGASMALKVCSKCGAKNAQAVRFCNNCGTNLAEVAAPPSGKCPSCGVDNPPGTKFCGGCGGKLA
jgi:ribosomal protein L40E